MIDNYVDYVSTEKELKDFLKREIRACIKAAGSPEKLSKDLGKSKAAVRMALQRNSLTGLKALYLECRKKLQNPLDSSQ